MNRNSEVLRLLVDWYEKQVADEPKQGPGIRIGTLDNPGWWVKIDYSRIQGVYRGLAERNIDRDELDWIQCKIEESKFDGAGGVRNLCEIVEVYLSAVEPGRIGASVGKSRYRELSSVAPEAVESDVIKMLVDWYDQHCDGDWEHDERIRIGTLDSPGWWVTVNLEGTEAQDIVLPGRLTEKSDVDWMSWKVEAGKFLGYGGVRNLFEIVEKFLLVVDPDLVTQTRP